ncbi:MAG: T9SS type A sorting domain-containing protein [Ignavibacteria bacterium]|nr:T9SS type A sorting domain-containing protein [Ignavibacteria bacterium]
MTPGNFVRSNDNGASFSNTFGASNTLPGMMVCVGANVLGGNNIPGGCVYVVTNTGSSFSATYSFYRSTNGGASFDFMSAQNFANFVGTNVQGRNSVQNMRTRPYPYITADNSYGPNRGRLYLIYSSNTPVGDGNKPDIFCRYSTDHGVNWSNETRVNDDANTTLHNQWHPATWCDKETGRLYVQWMDTRDTPTSDSALIYASYSTDGGLTFVQNKQISNRKFRINCTTCGGGGTPTYLGDYNSLISNPVTSMLAWADFRNNNFGSYVAYYPDYAMKTNTSAVTVNNGQSTTFRAIVPSVKDYNNKVKFTARIDTLPASGTLNVSFVGKDSITSYPDSVQVRVEAVGNVTPGRYRVKVEGRGPNGTPAHRRIVDVLVNSSFVSVRTNRPGVAEFQVNGVTYNQPQQLVFTNGTNVTVRAISPRVVGPNQYTFVNWSNGGDTTQTINVTSSVDLVASYKLQYRLIMTSSQGNTFGGNVFYDSGSSATFGVLSRRIVNGGTTYYFRGWTGGGTGSYTSPDSSGADSAVTVQMRGPITETARWATTIGINQLSSLVPEKYNLFQNYPNPFNPSTNIKFDIVKLGAVKIVIYDALGRESEVLVNEVLSPGSYNADFNAANLPSGIYYYKIITADFSDVKKMLLIK